MPKAATTDATADIVRALVKALEDKKAIDLKVLRVTAQSTITDYLVVATGNSEPHLRALRIEVEKVLDSAKVPIAGMDTGEYGSGWTVVDAYQVMVHVFTEEKRAAYALETLWRDAEEISVGALDARPVRKGKAKTKAPAKARTSRKSAGKPASKARKPRQKA
jgi:ribosome-associated protein